ITETRESVPYQTRSIPSARKQPPDRHQHNCAQRRRRNAVEDTAAEYPELRENPSPQNCPDQSEYDIRNASKSPAARNLSRKPACNETDEQPSNHGTWHGEEKEVHGVLLFRQAPTSARALSTRVPVASYSVSCPGREP